MSESHISATHIQIFDKHWRCKFNLDLGRLLDGEFIIRLFDGAPAPKYEDNLPVMEINAHKTIIDEKPKS